MSLLNGETVKVLRHVMTLNEVGDVVRDEQTEEVVDGVLFAPTSSHDLAIDRPNGVRIDASFYFPKTYTKSLKDCEIECRGHVFRVEGEPLPYPEQLTPTDFNREAGAVVVDG